MKLDFYLFQTFNFLIVLGLRTVTERCCMPHPQSPLLASGLSGVLLLLLTNHLAIHCYQLMSCFHPISSTFP